MKLQTNDVIYRCNLLESKENTQNIKGVKGEITKEFNPLIRIVTSCSSMELSGNVKNKVIFHSQNQHKIF